MNDAVHTLALRVYWEDTDAGGVVFYANYLKFFERARTEWLRARGFGQESLRVEHGLMFVVSETQVHYRAPARLDDLLQVSVHLDEVRPASLLIRQQALREGRLLAEGRIRIACVDAERLRPRPIPSFLLDVIS